MPKPLSDALIGTWELSLREDRNSAGEIRPEPTLGADPLGLLIYDRSGRFAAQFMKRDRTTSSPNLEADMPRPAPPSNNSIAQGGYDAYFGAYSVDDVRGLVTQTLHGALSPQSIGQVVTRAAAVEGDTLMIGVDTTNVYGEAVHRTLRFRRVA
jgi:hypothetical protein